jgi:hypothetical protein
MEHQDQDESGEKNTAVQLNKEIVLPTTDNRECLPDAPVARADALHIHYRQPSHSTAGSCKHWYNSRQRSQWL